ncbi:uncharacterized protein LOC129760319 [Uranotaenia lowii]|uniref:uncharacterized protein LOC129760319 n=1 Tax=Uranotaenia lowii TaxID=190385 RepID=UPI002479EE59|nr:uncharacterized protein LOC129760319 [Uranotaenia lowii]
MGHVPLKDMQSDDVKLCIDNLYIQAIKARWLKLENEEIPIKNAQTFIIDPIMKKFVFVGVTIRCKETGMYLCFDKNWKIKGVKNIGNIVNRPRCHFKESLDPLGYFQYPSVKDSSKYLGFTGNGKPINFKSNRTIDEKCQNIQRINAANYTAEFFSTHHPVRHKHNQQPHRRKHNHLNRSQENLPDSYPNSSGLSSSQQATAVKPFVPARSPKRRLPQSQRTTPLQMSNDVHTPPTSTIKPTKIISTKKQVKPSKRLGKINKKPATSFSSNSSNSGSVNIRHQHHHHHRNHKPGVVKTTPTATAF